jgi:hypothetical protein
MKVTMTVAELNSIGNLKEIQDKTYGGDTLAVFEALEPFLDKLESLSKVSKAYVKEHGDGEKIPRYTEIPADMVDQSGEPLSQDLALRMGVIHETEEWQKYMRFLNDQLETEFELEVTPCLTRKAAKAANLTPAELRVFKKLGILCPESKESEKPKGKRNGT